MSSVSTVGVASIRQFEDAKPVVVENLMPDEIQSAQALLAHMQSFGDLPAPVVGYIRGLDAPDESSALSNTTRHKLKNLDEQNQLAGWVNEYLAKNHSPYRFKICKWLYVRSNVGQKDLVARQGDSTQLALVKIENGKVSSKPAVLVGPKLVAPLDAMAFQVDADKPEMKPEVVVVSRGTAEKQFNRNDSMVSVSDLLSPEKIETQDNSPSYNNVFEDFYPDLESSSGESSSGESSSDESSSDDGSLTCLSPQSSLVESLSPATPRSIPIPSDSENSFNKKSEAIKNRDRLRLNLARFKPSAAGLPKSTIAKTPAPYNDCDYDFERDDEDSVVSVVSHHEETCSDKRHETTPEVQTENIEAIGESTPIAQTDNNAGSINNLDICLKEKEDFEFKDFNINEAMTPGLLEGLPAFSFQNHSDVPDAPPSYNNIGTMGVLTDGAQTASQQFTPKFTPSSNALRARLAPEVFDYFGKMVEYTVLLNSLDEAHIMKVLSDRPGVRGWYYLYLQAKSAELSAKPTALNNDELNKLNWYYKRIAIINILNSRPVLQPEPLTKQVPSYSMLNPHNFYPAQANQESFYTSVMSEPNTLISDNFPPLMLEPSYPTQQPVEWLEELSVMPPNVMTSRSTQQWHQQQQLQQQSLAYSSVMEGTTSKPSDVAHGKATTHTHTLELSDTLKERFFGQSSIHGPINYSQSQTLIPQRRLSRISSHPDFGIDGKFDDIETMDLDMTDLWKMQQGERDLLEKQDQTAFIGNLNTDRRLVRRISTTITGRDIEFTSVNSEVNLPSAEARQPFSIEIDATSQPVSPSHATSSKNTQPMIMLDEDSRAQLADKLFGDLDQRSKIQSPSDHVAQVTAIATEKTKIEQIAEDLILRGGDFVSLSKEVRGIAIIKVNEIEMWGLIKSELIAVAKALTKFVNERSKNAESQVTRIQESNISSEPRGQANTYQRLNTSATQAKRPQKRAINSVEASEDSRSVKYPKLVETTIIDEMHSERGMHFKVSHFSAKTVTKFIKLPPYNLQRLDKLIYLHQDPSLENRYEFIATQFNSAKLGEVNSDLVKARAEHLAEMPSNFEAEKPTVDVDAIRPLRMTTPNAQTAREYKRVPVPAHGRHFMLSELPKNEAKSLKEMNQADLAILDGIIKKHTQKAGPKKYTLMMRRYNKKGFETVTVAMVKERVAFLQSPKN
ncbi:hypothetical protein D5R81_18310 [Parashewanella spongiae]|uniref:Uncharacterized protein n=1 Tax=Parashewanella spongiae TaxID=342950 RepID=A0A3A6TES9_9GAMM|nr:hypothetical protein [Parashewanella spongiae]MCL1078756.1 hypothetical protein [Parashewanella spongiae]RJY05985.1 hypothetical protein D5R81_18310 [Parashewanella spongiae]